MGGKGGGGGDDGKAAAVQLLTSRGVDMNRYMTDPNYMNDVSRNGNWEPSKYDQNGKPKAAPAPAPKPAPAAAPVAAPAAAPAPAPAAPAGPPAALGPAIDSGGAIDQPKAAGNLGNELGDAVLKPPKYWVGGLDSYTPATPQAGRGQGAMKTNEV